MSSEARRSLTLDATRGIAAIRVWLGEISYPVYALHAPLVMLLQPATMLPGMPAFSLPFELAAAACVVVAAFVLSRAWDIPVRRALPRPADRMRAMLASVAAKP